MKFISTGRLSFQLIYPFIVPFGTLIRAIAFTVIDKVYDKFLFFSAFIFIADIVGGMTYLCINTSKNEEIKEQQEKAVEEIVINLSEIGVQRRQSVESHSEIPQQNIIIQKDRKKLKLFLYFAIPALFHFLSFNILSVVCSSHGIYLNSIQAELKNGRLIFTSLICLCVFRFHYYKHHILAIVLIIAGLIVNMILLGVHLYEQNETKKEDEKIDYVFMVVAIILFFLTYLLDGLKVVFEKQFLEKFKIVPLQAVFIEGVSGLIINIAFSLIFSLIPCNFESELCNQKQKTGLFDYDALGTALSDGMFYLFLFLILISSIIDNVFSMLSIYYFLPTHQNVSDAISSCLLWIVINAFYSEDLQSKVAFYVQFGPFPGYLISILGALLYNEILVLHCCGLSEDTKKEITDRAETEKMEISQDNLLLRKYSTEQY